MCCCSTTDKNLTNIETNHSSVFLQTANVDATEELTFHCPSQSTNVISTTTTTTNITDTITTEGSHMQDNRKLQYDKYMEKAVQHLIQGKPTDAIDQLESGLRCQDGRELEPQRRMEIYINYATAYEQLEQWQQALQCLHKAITLMDTRKLARCESSLKLLTSLRLRVSYLQEIDNDSGDIEPVKSWINTAKSFMELGQVDTADTCAWRAAYCLSKICMQRKSDSLLKQVADFIEDLPFGTLKAILLNGFGVVLLGHGWPLKATSYFQQAYENLSPKRTKLSAIILQNVGTAHAATKRCDLAISALSKALEMYRKRQNYKGVAETASNLGYVWAICGKWATSRWNYVMAKQAAGKAHLDHIADQANRAIQTIDKFGTLNANQALIIFKSASIMCFCGAAGDIIAKPTCGKRNPVHSPPRKHLLTSSVRSSSPSMTSSESLDCNQTSTGDLLTGDFEIS